MSAIASFILELGIETAPCPAMTALRIRVSMSEIGSETGIVISPKPWLPRRLHNTWNPALKGLFAQAYATHLEAPVITPGAATNAAPIAYSNLIFATRLPYGHAFLGHATRFS
jgi:hypothetical protein